MEPCIHSNAYKLKQAIKHPNLKILPKGVPLFANSTETKRNIKFVKVHQIQGTMHLYYRCCCQYQTNLAKPKYVTYHMLAILKIFSLLEQKLIKS